MDSSLPFVFSFYLLILASADELLLELDRFKSEANMAKSEAKRALPSSSSGSASADELLPELDRFNSEAKAVLLSSSSGLASDDELLPELERASFFFAAASTDFTTAGDVKKKRKTIKKMLNDAM